VKRRVRTGTAAGVLVVWRVLVALGSSSGHSGSDAVSLRRLVAVENETCLARVFDAFLEPRVITPDSRCAIFSWRFAVRWQA
jgi:hypothetical protein